MFELLRSPRVRDLTQITHPMKPRKVSITIPQPYFALAGEYRTTKQVYDALEERARMCRDSHKVKKRVKMTGPTCMQMQVHYTLFYQNKPLSRAEVALEAYGAPRMVLELRYYSMLGGSDVEPHRLYTHIMEAERLVLSEVRPCGATYSVQAGEEDPDDPGESDGLHHMRFGTAYVVDRLTKRGWDLDYVNKLIEDVIFLIKMLIKAKDVDDYYMAIVVFVKFNTPDCNLFSSKCYNRLCKFFDGLFNGFDLQSAEDTFATCRDFLGKYEEVKNAPIFKKVYKFAMYALSMSLFEKIGVNFDLFSYSKLEAEAIKRKFHSGPDFVHCMMDTLLFVCERGYQCLKTGSMDPIYHSGSTYEKWFDQVIEMKTRFRVLQTGTNPHERFEILADLRDLIEKGEAIKKHAVRVGKQETRMITGLVHDLCMLLSEETTKRAAQQERKSPFSVLLYGGSSVGKSTLTKMLFYQYGKTFDLPLGSEFKFTRNANANFWDGFNSSQWCVQLDDIAFMHPSKAANGDPTIMEMLQVVNNVPFVPDQASLEDKGRTPMRAEFVIATTNCETLNAFHYFQTPLAVQRRLPFVIDVKPKPEYTKDACMLDSSAVQMEDGQWPNYWTFEIKRVVPAGTERERQQGQLETIHVFDDVNKFLSWFSRVAVEHSTVQQKVDDCDVGMKNIVICKQCYMNTMVCECEPCVDVEVQAFDYEGPIAPTRTMYLLDLVKYAILAIITKILSYHAVSGFLCHLFRLDMTQDAIMREFIPDQVALNACRAQMRWLGERVQKKIGAPKLLLGVAATLASVYAAKKMYDFIAKPAFQTQGTTSASTGAPPVPRENEKQNVWFKDDFSLSAFDVSSHSISWNNMEFTQVASIVGKNCVALRSHFTNADGVAVSRPVKAFGVKGHIYVTNSHGLPDVESFKLEMIRDYRCEGVNGNIVLTMHQCDIYRVPSSDIAFFRVRNLPPVKSLESLFPKHPIKGVYSGTYVTRMEDGSMNNRQLDCIKSKSTPQQPGFELPIDSWHAFTRVATTNGDCGSVMLAQTPMGPIILGIHVMGGGNEVFSIPLTIDIVQMGMGHFVEPHMEPTAPRLDVPGFETPLMDLHHKSVMRYIEDGTARVYGSFSGFKQAPKSHVRPTFISEIVQAQCDVPVKTTKPQMSGYVPWRIAAVEMVKPVTDINTDVLAECVEQYTKDILSGLSEEDLAEIMVYDDMTAINGAAGVQFVDKMNRNTSAGFPFKKGKKNFLTPCVGPAGSEWVHPDPIIMEAVEEIHRLYTSGQRASPIFNGHLKDEAISHAKAKIGKTRVFTGAPFAWSIINRKYLLSVTRVLQRNRYVWEGMPGMNAMSDQWEEFYQYVTQHGEDQLIGGDYRFFDKQMPPTLVLAAFDVLRNICKAAGFTLEDLLCVQGIAEDTAFSFVDFNGDLVEFFGTNPSGHPLTVIINGIVNALYVRMCYHLLNPAREVRSFKKNVALGTYGDDNLMGVSKRTPWFTHTTLQATLKSFGIDYTMADKTAESVPYIHISEASFLKRSFRFESEVGMHMPMLEEDSIWKSLTMGVVSGTLCPEAQSAEVIKGAVREFFYHGREVFETRSMQLQKVVELAGLDNYMDMTLDFPTWDECVNKWLEDNGAK